MAEGHERSAGVWRALLEAASGDGEVEGWRVELERRRRAAVADGVQKAIGADLDPLLLDLLWAVLGPVMPALGGRRGLGGRSTRRRWWTPCCGWCGLDTLGPVRAGAAASSAAAGREGLDALAGVGVP